MDGTLDVVIVGAGPGGLSAALRLAAAGCRVTLFEEHDEPGRPVHCTGVLAAEAFDEFDLPRDVVLNQIRTFRFVSPAGTVVPYTTDEIEALVIDRALFDRRLAARAMHAGARIVTGHRVMGVTVDARGVSVDVAGQPAVRARAAVLACGTSYGLHRRLGLGLPPVLFQTAQMELPAERVHDVELHFGSRVAPKGFGWVVPVVRDRTVSARVGVMAAGGAAGRFDYLCGQIGARWGLRRGESRPRLKVLPLAPISPTQAARVIAVGDAAGLVKATTGGGIYYSLLTGTLAGETLIDALDRDDLSAPALAVYERAWQDRLAPELRAQQLLRRLVHQMSDAQIDALFELARTDGVLPIVRRVARFNRHRPVILSLLRYRPVRNLVVGRMLG
jgi:geranylgeranyl reductase family protein